MRIGYMRPFEEDLDCQSQRAHLEQYPCEEYKVETHRSAKKRVVLDQIIQQLQPNDILIVYKLLVLADSTKHLSEVLDALLEQRAYLISLQENIDTSEPEGQIFHTHVHKLLSFQSDIISENTKKGMYAAKQKGNLAGRPRKLDDNIKRAIEMYDSKKYTLAQIREQTGISKSTLYRYLEH